MMRAACAWNIRAPGTVKCRAHVLAKLANCSLQTCSHVAMRAEVKPRRTDIVCAPKKWPPATTQREARFSGAFEYSADQVSAWLDVKVLKAPYGGFSAVPFVIMPYVLLPLSST